MALLTFLAPGTYVADMHACLQNILRQKIHLKAVYLLAIGFDLCKVGWLFTK